jgi:hypothetical protein
MTSNNDHSLDDDAKNTFFKLKRARKLNVQDFMKATNHMPTAFVLSFYKSEWTTGHKNLPSQGLKPCIDLKTFKWKDMKNPQHENLH